MAQIESGNCFYLRDDEKNNSVMCGYGTDRMKRLLLSVVLVEK